MSAQPLEPYDSSRIGSPGSARRPPVLAWPLLVRQPGSSFLRTLLDDPDRSRRLSQLPGDLLIGVPLGIVGRAVARYERVRTWALAD